MTRPRLLDLFAGAGGCSVGYDRAGWDVTGWDLLPHPDYPFELHIGDALEVLKDHDYLDTFDAVHTSPPCDGYSTITSEDARGNHPLLIAPVRELLRAWGGLYVIENVQGAARHMDHPVKFCGGAFGLGVRRHRLFESNAFLMSPGCVHPSEPPVGVYGTHGEDKVHMRPDTGTRRGIKARDAAHAREVMGIDWMTKWEDLGDAVPPAYTECIGGQLLDHLAVAA